MDLYSKKTLEHFRGKAVRKDLTNMMKRGVNVPGYVLEYLLGMYCATDNQDVINTGIKKITNILTSNYVRHDELEKVKFILSQKGEYTIIDKIVGRVDEDEDLYVGSFSNFNIGEFIIDREYAKKYPKVFTGGIWCMAKIKYENFKEMEVNEDGIEVEKVNNRHTNEKRKTFLYSPYSIIGLKPIQIPNFNVDSIIDLRKEFTLDEWIVLVLRSVGIEAVNLNEKERYHFIERLVPLFERNYNLVELGPRGTGKSHVYKEISPYSVLISGGQTSISSLFYNLTRKTMGLVGNWDCIAFDEIAGMGFNNPNGIQILKDYMASGSFSRGKEIIYADASMVFIGNVNDTIENMLKISNLFSPFPETFRYDSAFFDRMHYYLPGWEIPKIKSEHLTEEFGLISDCFAEFARDMRSVDCTHVFDEWYKFNSNVNIRDENAIRKTVSGFVKILFPDNSYTKEDLEKILTYAIEGRRRVKEQLRKMIGEEFSDVDLGYITNDGKEVIVNVPEKISETLIGDKSLPIGHIFSVGYSHVFECPSLYKLETVAVSGNGNIEIQGVRGVGAKTVSEALNAGWKQFLEYGPSVCPVGVVHGTDYLLFVNDIQRRYPSTELSVAEFISLCSASSEKKVRESLVVLGEVTISGTIKDIKGIEDYLRVAFNAGAKNILLPKTAKPLIDKIDEEDFLSLNYVYYNNIVEAAKYALGIED